MDISQAERQKYAEIFTSNNPINGYITGNHILLLSTHFSASSSALLRRHDDLATPCNTLQHPAHSETLISRFIQFLLFNCTHASTFSNAIAE
jgi:hypothetical protein